jgi:hypothetical protein
LSAFAPTHAADTKPNILLIIADDMGYSFDQYLYQPCKDSKEGLGIFGQFGIWDGNPSRLYWWPSWA